MLTKKILIQWANPNELIFRQTPNREGIWGDAMFTTNINDGPFDIIAVLENTTVPIKAIAKHAIFIPGEPPDIRHYPRGFLEQFTIINTSLKKKWPIFQSTEKCALNWHVGWKHSLEGEKAFWYDYDYSLSDKPKKNKSCSCISSSKAVIPGHVKRLKFAKFVEEKLKNKVDLYGKGLKMVDDKYDALHDYKYHIAIENSRVDGYWTEKICDSLLTLTVPFYYGNPEIKNILPKGSYIPIDIDNPQQAIDIISSTIDDESDYESRIPALKEAKRLLLEEYNIFSVLSNMRLEDVPHREFDIKSQNHHMKVGDSITDLYVRGKRTVLRKIVNLTYNV